MKKGNHSAAKKPFMDRYEPSTLGGLFHGICRSYGDNEAIIFKNERITYRTFWSRATALAKSLAKLGLQKGDHVGLWISNRPEFMYTQFAVALLGGILVVINPRYKTHELSHVLAQLEISTLIMIDRFMHNDYTDMIGRLIPELGKGGKTGILSDAYPSLRRIILLSDEGKNSIPGAADFHTLMEEGSGPGGDAEILARMREVRPDDTAMIMLTSGTSGLPKGALLTHNSICWSNSWAFPRWSEITPDDRILCPVPLTNTGGSLSFSASSATCGSTLLLMEKFDPEEAMVLMKNEGCTFIRGVPSMYTMWLSLPSLEKYNLSTIRRGITSGSPISPGALEEVMRRITPNMFTAYGMTEFSCLTSQTVFSDPLEKKLFTAGRAFPGSLVEAFNVETGQREGPGKIGELCVKGPHVMKGYYKQPERTREAIDAEGWLHTGDLGFVDDDGYISIVGRSKEMLITGGFNVYPREVELVLEQYKKVKLAAVVSVPDAVMGEVPAAFIEPREGAGLTPQEIYEFCKSEIANYKVPRYVRLVKEWPMLGIGKIDKANLREQLIRDLERNGEERDRS